MGLIVVLLLLIASVGFIGYTYSQSDNSLTGAVIGLQDDFSTQADCGVSACSCGDTVTSSYTLTEDLTGCSGVGKIGLTIGANDITIDCAGYSIIGGLDTGGMGIRNLEFNNMIVQNCYIESFERGINLEATGGDTIGGQILDTTITSSPTGIYVANNHTIINNVDISFSGTYGINLYQYVFNITIANSSLSSNTGPDIYIAGRAGNQLNHTLYGNTIEDSLTLEGGSLNVLLYDNKFTSGSFVILDDGTNKWNTTHQNGTNINRGPTIGGNYYATYSGVDINDDGIGETSFEVDTGVFDYLPLVQAYQFLGPSTDLTFNSTFNHTNEMVHGSLHFTEQNITFLNGTVPILTINATFTTAADLSTSTIDYNDTAIVTDFATSSGISLTHNLYLNNSINDNGVVVCPDATSLSQVTQSCSNSIEITKTNITDGVYVEGVFVSTEGNRYRIENVSGTGAIINRNASLRIWDENDAGELHGGQSRTDNQTIIFYANFTDTGTSAITDATCTATFHDGSTASMIYDASDQLYNGNNSYALNTTYTWNASCSSTNYLPLQTNDSVSLSYGDPWCGKTLYLDTDLTQNLNGSGTCFIVARDNIVINGTGYNISSNDETGYGINVTGFSNITIHSFNAIEGYQYGAYLESSPNSSITNSTIINRDVSNSEGIYITNSDYLNLSNLTISTFGQQSDGIRIINSQENNYYNNDINTAGQFSDGITSSGSNSSNITNNLIQTEGIDAAGIYLLNYARNNTFTYNNITTTNPMSDGIYLTYSSNNTFTNNNLSIEGTSGGAQGIVLFTSSHQNNFEFNTLATIDSDGLGMNLSNSNFNFFDNNYVFTTGSAASGLSFEGTSNTNLLISNIFNTTGTNARALTLKDTVENNTFTNNSFIAAQIGAIEDLTSVSYNQTLNYSTSTGYISWISIGNLSSIMNISFNDTIILRNNTAAFNSSASESINNSEAEIGLTGLNNSYNQVFKWETYNDSVNQSLINSEGSDCISTGDCTLLGYDAGTDIFKFTVNTFSAYSAVFQPAESCGLISESKTLTSSITTTTTGTCFVIDQNDVTLDCNNYYIEGIDDGIAINSIGRTNVSIINCNISHFEKGIYVNDIINLTLDNLLLEHSGSHYAQVLLQNLNGGNISDINISNSSLRSFYLDNSHNLTFTNINSSDNFHYYIQNSNQNIFDTLNIYDSLGAISLTNSHQNNFSNLVIEENNSGINVGISNSNTFSNITINGFNNTNNLGLIYIVGENNSFNDFTIYNSGDYGYGIKIGSGSGNNFSNGFINGSTNSIWLNSAINNYFNQINLSSPLDYGIMLSSLSEYNTFLNMEFINMTKGSINDTIIISTRGNSLIFNNSFGQINWTSTNLTTNINLSVGETIFLENNNTGLLTETGSPLQLDGQANIEIKGLDFTETPHLSKDGSVCDNGDTCNVTAYTGNTLFASVGSFSNYSGTSNTAPTIDFNFTNDPIYTNTSSIFINFTTTDAEGDLPTVNLSWFVNGVSIKNTSISSNPNDVPITENLSLTDYDYNRSDIINLSIFVYDSVNANSTFSNATTVQNTLPDVYNITFNQSSYTTNEDISVNGTISDVDLDEMNVTLRWYINESQFGSTQLFEDETNGSTINDSFLDPSDYSKYSEINVSFTAFDGSSSTTEWTSLMNISNTPPEQSTNLSDVPSTDVGVTTTINLSSYFTDDDGDALIFILENVSIANFTIDDSTGILTIVSNATGTATTYVNATDAENTTIGNNFTITVATPTTTTTTSTGGGGGSSGGGSGGIMITPTPSIIPSIPKIVPLEYYTPEEARNNIRVSLKTASEDNNSLEGFLVVENFGEKILLGKQNIIDTPEEHNYLLRTKTLGSQNGLFENLLPIWYSGNAPLGNLLKAKLENDPKFTVNPGERKEIPYKIKSPLFINPRTLWVSIETFGEMVTLNGVVMEEYTATGSAIDLIESENSLDLYLIISPSNVDTGAAIGLIEDSSNFMYELSINKEGLFGGFKFPAKFKFASSLFKNTFKKTLFTDIYGPYHVQKGESFILAQQFSYRPELFKGNHIVSTTLYKDGGIVLQNDFEVNIGASS
ncbi:hypothetical protein HOD05_03800 [Candidatus Woesearchaeota archaeon]|nr:hypothetical protein [Candidatus Woesearchaeota archaeon]MBT4150677.1 hypothetical protein [Candidatus Woesearchaeota archaeon]MBT4247895.1 hypothetical protein [Candidatus Woesearchaeota archaeon]MBT4434319.1 hypothetical protein [Candidatus Woesearchaeota archaeon]